MNNKIAVRAAIGIAAILVLFLGYKWFQSWSIDPQLTEKVNTKDFIAAIEQTKNGGRLVTFSPDGKKTEITEGKEGYDDRELSWSPLGNHVYFSSNREDRAYNIYRWNPQTNAIEKKSKGSRSQGAPKFPTDDQPEAVRAGLIITGGMVFEFDPRMQTLKQTVPPLSKDSAASEDQESGRVEMLSGIYEKLGTAFRQAQWGPNREVVYATMRRDGGEVFVRNPLVSDPSGRPPMPAPIFAGDRVEFDTGGNGSCVAAIRGFQFVDPSNVPEEFLKDGKAVPPYRNAVMLIPESGQPAMIFTNPDDKVAFSQPKLSNDGKNCAMVVGKIENGDLIPEGLIVFPAEPTGASKVLKLVDGNISSLSWSADGNNIAFLLSEEGHRVIYTIGKDGRGLRRVSEPGKDYRTPLFSPFIE